MIKRTSKKQDVINRKYKQMISEYDENTERRCTGCGKYHPGVALSHSHLISRGDANKIGMPELIFDPKNIRYHCLSLGNHKGCHEKWESKDRDSLLDYEENMAYIKSVSEEMYNKYLV